MNHWILDIIFIVVGALIIFINAKRGLFLSLLKFCKLMLSIGRERLAQTPMTLPSFAEDADFAVCPGQEETAVR